MMTHAISAPSIFNPHPGDAIRFAIFVKMIALVGQAPRLRAIGHQRSDNGLPCPEVVGRHRMMTHATSGSLDRQSPSWRFAHFSRSIASKNQWRMSSPLFIPEPDKQRVPQGPLVTTRTFVKSRFFVSSRVELANMATRYTIAFSQTAVTEPPYSDMGDRTNSDGSTSANGDEGHIFVSPESDSRATQLNGDLGEVASPRRNQYNHAKARGQSLQVNGSMDVAALTAILAQRKTSEDEGT